MSSRIKVDITDASEFHCFRMALTSKSGDVIEVMLHASALVDLIREASGAYCEWSRRTSEYLICEKLGITADEARQRGLIA